MDNMLSTNVRIESIEDKGTQIKFKADKTYSFFKNKKDGSATAAFAAWQNLNVQVGSVLALGYKEVPLSNGGHINSVLTIKPAQGLPEPKAPVKGKFEATEAKDEQFWDKKAYKQCLWNYFLQATTHNIQLAPGWQNQIWKVFQDIETDAQARFTKPVEAPYVDHDEAELRSLQDSDPGVNVDGIPF